MTWKSPKEQYDALRKQPVLQGYARIDFIAETVQPMVRHGGTTIVTPEVPISLRENGDVQSVGGYFPLGVYGFGADIVAGGVSLVHNALKPSGEQLPGMVERLSGMLRIVGAEEYAQSLSEVRTTWQVEMLELLVSKAAALTPKIF